MLFDLEVIGRLKIAIKLAQADGFENMAAALQRLMELELSGEWREEVQQKNAFRMMDTDYQ